jgi:hypothetical protein
VNFGEQNTDVFSVIPRKLFCHASSVLHQVSKFQGCKVKTLMA